MRKLTVSLLVAAVAFVASCKREPAAPADPVTTTPPPEGADVAQASPSRIEPAKPDGGVVPGEGTPAITEKPDAGVAAPEPPKPDAGAAAVAAGRADGAAEPGAPPAPGPDGEIVVKDVGFQTPESVRHDPEADVYLVANIHGSPLAADDNGFVSRVRPDGTVEDLKWIDGSRDDVALNAPKGMAIQGEDLFVADLDRVRVFDRRTGAPKGEVPIEGATFLNDVAAGPAGSVYVSDSGLKAGGADFEASGTDAVYRIDAGRKVVAIARGEELGRPNGLLADGDRVWVNTFGSGELYSIGPDGKRAGVVKPEGGAFDGLERAPDGELILSSWGAKAVLKGPPAGPFRAIFSGLDAPADLGLDLKRKRVLVPRFEHHALEIRPLPE